MLIQNLVGRYAVGAVLPWSAAVKEIARRLLVHTFPNSAMLAALFLVVICLSLLTNQHLLCDVGQG